MTALTNFGTEGVARLYREMCAPGARIAAAVPTAPHPAATAPQTPAAGEDAPAAPVTDGGPTWQPPKGPVVAFDAADWGEGFGYVNVELWRQHYGFGCRLFLDGEDVTAQAFEANPQEGWAHLFVLRDGQLAWGTHADGPRLLTAYRLGRVEIRDGEGRVIS